MSKRFVLLSFANFWLQPAKAQAPGGSEGKIGEGYTGTLRYRRPFFAQLPFFLPFLIVLVSF